MYIATDSRSSVVHGKQVHYWDCCQKVYSSLTAPIIIGYVGDVQYGSQLGPRLLQLAELLTQDGFDFQQIVGQLDLACKSALSEQHRSFNLATTFQFVVACRYGKRDFHVASIDFQSSGTIVKILPMPTQSGIILSLGTGGKNVQKQVDSWKKTAGESTSRAVFTAHCDALLSEEREARSLNPKLKAKDYRRDNRSGGAPQLAGLYRIGAGIIHGVVWKKQRFICGIPYETVPSGLNWRDRKFQRCDPLTGKLIQGAKKHVHEVSVKRHL